MDTMTIPTVTREELHRRAMADSVRAILMVYHVTPASHSHIIQRIFVSCAKHTGRTLEIMKDVQNFRDSDHVPDYVLQCCSGKAYKEGIRL